LLQQLTHYHFNSLQLTCKMGAPLHRADGSATYSANGYTVLASVNGPIEVQRRDELAEEAAVEVHVRPASGVGGMLTYPPNQAISRMRRWNEGEADFMNFYLGTRERYLESILHSTLTRVILTHQFPRTLIQLTIQILSIPDYASLPPSSIKTNPSSVCLPALLRPLRIPQSPNFKQPDRFP
jgi:exosome complex component RRP46